MGIGWSRSKRLVEEFRKKLAKIRSRNDDFYPVPKKRRITRRHDSDRDILAYLAEAHDSGRPASISGLMRSVGVGWKRGKEIMTKFEADPDHYVQIYHNQSSVEDDHDRHSSPQQSLKSTSSAPSNEPVNSPTRIAPESRRFRWPPFSQPTERPLR
eukprot:1129180_1